MATTLPSKTALMGLTLRESLATQLLWVLVGLWVLGATFALIMGSVAPAAEKGFVTTSTAFLCEGALLAYGLFQGASLVAKDFSSRGLCELLVPHGLTRTHILLQRMGAHFITLALLAGVLFGSRWAILGLLIGTVEHINATVQMAVLGWARGAVLFSLATWLGVGIRPLLAQLGAATLFFCGHFTGPLATVQRGLNHLERGYDNEVLGPIGSTLLKVAQVWDPNQWVVVWDGQQWETAGPWDFMVKALWPMAFVMAFVCFALGACRRKPILGAHT